MSRLFTRLAGPVRLRCWAAIAADSLEPRRYNARAAFPRMSLIMKSFALLLLLALWSIALPSHAKWIAASSRHFVVYSEESQHRCRPSLNDSKDSTRRCGSYTAYLILSSAQPTA